MRLAFFVNDLAREAPRFTTTLLAREAVRRGHEVFYVDVDGFCYQPDDRLTVHARIAPSVLEPEAFVESLREAELVHLDVGELDVLFLRNNPADDVLDRPWAQHVGVQFGLQAAERGVAVVNGPAGLARALDKLYFQGFPAEIRPRALISRDEAEIRAFVREEGGPVILKPLQGSGGKSVFLVRQDEHDNLNQMIEAVLRDGYVIAQEYVPEAAEGDVRFFLMDGEPLRVGDRYAVLRRVGAEGDARSNMHIGGTAEKAEVTPAMLRIAELVRDKLVRDGLFLVGLDIVGDKVLEINVFSPGGLHSASLTQDADFAGAVLDALEARKRT